MRQQLPKLSGRWVAATESRGRLGETPRQCNRMSARSASSNSQVQESHLLEFPLIFQKRDERHFGERVEIQRSQFSVNGLGSLDDETSSVSYRTCGSYFEACIKFGSAIPDLVNTD